MHPVLLLALTQVVFPSEPSTAQQLQPQLCCHSLSGLTAAPHTMPRHPAIRRLFTKQTWPQSHPCAQASWLPHLSSPNPKLQSITPSHSTSHCPGLCPCPSPFCCVPSPPPPHPPFSLPPHAARAVPNTPAAPEVNVHNLCLPWRQQALAREAHQRRMPRSHSRARVPRTR